MYIPKPNQVHDDETIAEFIGAHGFATVITAPGGVPYASHLPVLHDKKEGVLWSHMARANEQWRHFADGKEVLCIFHGPHAYISPSWYEAKVAVPTWNYAVAHVYGVAEIVQDPATLRKIVEDVTEKYEKRFENPWELQLPEDTIHGLLKAIVGFSIRITRIEAKFKLGQNRSKEDQESMLSALENDPEQDSKALGAFVKKMSVTGTDEPKAE
jgi:transcriptional regulator